MTPAALVVVQKIYLIWLIVPSVETQPKLVVEYILATAIQQSSIARSQETPPHWQEEQSIIEGDIAA